MLDHMLGHTESVHRNVTLLTKYATLRKCHVISHCAYRVYQECQV